MKFLCDRCKTRYAIADERVRGKILKIRCKNCSAVITVREGMDESAEATAAAPPPAAGAPEPPPPAALQEEWYVSRDGNQEGPFTLTEAQAWIAARTSDDELFCWNEGFDDWLPVEKVSHFRGLRGTPRNRPATRPGAVKEPEPQPLFAATLAAIEAEAAAATPPAAPVVSQLPPSKTPAASQWKTPPTGDETMDMPMPEAAAPPPVAVAAAPAPRTPTPAVGVPAVPRAATPAAGLPSLPRAAAAKPPVPGPFGNSKTAPGVVAPPHLGAPAQHAAPNPFGASSPSPSPTPSPSPSAFPSPSASPTPTPFPNPSASPNPAPFPNPSASPTPTPFPNGTPSSPIAAGGAPAWSPPPPVAAPPPAANRFDTGDAADEAGDALDDLPPPAAAPSASTASFGDDLDIGEVSRVVKLADLGKTPRPAPAAAAAAKARAQTSGIGRATGAVATLPAAATSSFAAAGAGAPLAAPAIDPDPDPSQSLPVAQAPSRRSPALYIGIGVVAIAAAVVAVVVLSGGGGDDSSNETAGGNDYDNLGYRPDDPVRRPNDPAAAVDAGTVAVRNPDRGSSVIRRPTGSGSGSQTGTGSGTAADPVPTNPGLPELSPDDVFGMSSRMESGTRRCYERAMKDDPFLKVSKIRATISVSAAGPVTDVRLSTMADTQLGTCLVAAIKRWPFKPSKDGITSEFALVFEQK